MRTTFTMGLAMLCMLAGCIKESYHASILPVYKTVTELYQSEPAGNIRAVASKLATFLQEHYQIDTKPYNDTVLVIYGLFLVAREKYGNTSIMSKAEEDPMGCFLTAISSVIGLA